MAAALPDTVHLNLGLRNGDVLAKFSTDMPWDPYRVRVYVSGIWHMLHLPNAIPPNARSPDMRIVHFCTPLQPPPTRPMRGALTCTWSTFAPPPPSFMARASKWAGEVEECKDHMLVGALRRHFCYHPSSFFLYVQAPWPAGVTAHWYQRDVMWQSEFEISTEPLDMADHTCYFWTFSMHALRSTCARSLSCSDNARLAISCIATAGSMVVFCFAV